MKDLLEIDTSFNENMFITKVNHIFIMLYSAIMMDDMNRVRHFISTELERKYDKILNDLNSKNLRQMYDELNVKSTSIESVNITNDKIIINVSLIARYMDYLVNKETNKYVSGINDRRIEKRYHLVLEKTIGNNYSSIIRKCPNCGASIDINNNGQCKYCKSIFDMENHDYVLTLLEEYN